MLGNFLSFSILSIGIGIIFALPLYLRRVQLPNKAASWPLHLGLSIAAMLTSFFLMAFINATISNATGACTYIQASETCFPYYQGQAVHDSILSRELWFLSLLPPPMRQEHCVFGNTWICDNATGLLENTPQWNDYLYQWTFALLSFMGCFIFILPFGDKAAKSKNESPTQAQPNPQ